MDYEKKYKEALANMQELYNSMKYMSSTDALHTTMYLEKAFPELKKSEDEKIRKRILLSLEKDLITTKNSGCNTKDLEECIAWLEKQGQKPVDFKAKDWYISKVDGKIHNMTYNPTDKVEPNPAWSEEDEETLSRIRTIVRNNNSSRVEDILWLKSLKERMKGE